MLTEKEIKSVLENELQLNIDNYLELINNSIRILSEPWLFIRVLDKRIMLESLRKIKQEISHILVILDKCNSVKSVYDEIFNSTMTIVYKFRETQEHFNNTFDADAYVNMKTEEWRRYLRSSQAYSEVEDFRERISNYNLKVLIDFEIEQYSLMEFSNKWIETMMKSQQIGKSSIVLTNSNYRAIQE
jgi:hypothetical protein